MQKEPSSSNVSWLLEGLNFTQRLGRYFLCTYLSSAARNFWHTGCGYVYDSELSINRIRPRVGRRFAVVLIVFVFCCYWRGVRAAAGVKHGFHCYCFLSPFVCPELWPAETRSPLLLAEWLLWGNSNRWNVPWVAKTTAEVLEICLRSDGWAPSPSPSSLPSGKRSHQTRGRGVDGGKSGGEGTWLRCPAAKKCRLWGKIMSPLTKSTQHRARWQPGPQAAREVSWSCSLTVRWVYRRQVHGCRRKQRDRQR